MLTKAMKLLAAALMVSTASAAPTMSAKLTELEERLEAVKEMSGASDCAKCVRARPGLPCVPGVISC